MKDSKLPKISLSRASVLAVALAMVTMGLAAAPVTANHDDTDIQHTINQADDILPFDDKKDKIDKNSDKKPNDNKTIYVNLGLIGDHIIRCPSIYNLNGNVELFNPLDGSPVASVMPNLDIDADPGICLGGATGEYAGGEDIWDVWLTDYVWDSAEQVIPTDPGTGDKLFDFKVAAFAQLQTTVTSFDDKIKDPWDQCVGFGATGGTQLCVETDESRTETYTRNTHQFGMCGQAQITIDNTQLAPPPKVENIVDVTTTKNVAVDGPIFYLLDCGLGITGFLQGPWNTMATTVNSVTCSDHPNDPGDGLPNLICIFEELPAGSSDCLDLWPGGNDLGVPGLIGTVGWNHPANITKCEETTFDGTWVRTQGGPDVAVKNSPVLVDGGSVCISGTTVPGGQCGNPPPRSDP